MSEWTTEKPKHGEWWLSLAPENRPKRYPAVLRVCIASDGDMYLGDALGGACISWHDSVFDGAQWMPAKDPADPFTDPVNLSPEAERIWKSLSPATQVSGEDARNLLESLANVAPPDEIARRRAVSLERLSRSERSKSSGLEKRYDVRRMDGKTIKCGCIVLEFDDTLSQRALLVWADSMEAAGYAKVADDVRAAVNDANLFHFMPDGTRILKNPKKPSSRHNDLP